MKRSPSSILLAGALLWTAPAKGAFWGSAPTQSQDEDEAFSAASQLYQDPSRDRQAAAQAFEKFASQFSQSPRASDARFMAGEAHMQRALGILREEAATKKASSARLLAPKNPAASRALEEARRAFEDVVNDKDSGLAPSAEYRLGEVAYNAKDWTAAVDHFKAVEKKHPKSYIVGEALMGVIFADLALEQFSQAEANLFLMGETFPTYLKEPAVLYAQGIVALHKGDYAAAERALKAVKTAEAQYYLGKTFLLSNRAYLAAAAFQNLIRDYPDSDLKEEAQFFIGDSFFLAEDYDGAISKYQAFIALFPDSPLRVSATFRIGSSFFQKKDYVQARANFQAVLDKYPKDFFAPIAQYFIAESHLVSGQVREALFAYTKVITQYPDTIKVSPLAHYKLAWTQYQVGDFSQAVQTCENFLSFYPTSPLAKNVHLVMGNALAALNRHVEAVAALQRIIDAAPSSEIAEQALFLILQNQFNQKSYNSIVTSYQYIFRHLPPSKSKWRSMSYLYAAEAYLNLNQIDEAKVIYDMILKVYPDDPAAFYAQDGLAWAYSYKGDDRRALEERQKLKEMLSTVTSTFSFSGFNELGIADSLFNQKNYEDAYQLYDKFARDNPQAAQAPAALYRAGMSLYHQRYYTQAVEAWRKLQSDYPQAKETPLAAAQVADTLFRAQKYAEASAAYRRLLADYPASPQRVLASLRIAQSAFNMKDDAAVLKQIQELVAAHPAAPESADGMDLLEAVFDRSKGLDYQATLRGMIAADPASPIAGEAQFRLARRLFEAKNYAAAAVEFQRFSVDYTNNPQLGKAQFYLGESYFSQNDHQNAVPAFERFLANFDRGDDTRAALFHLASSYYSLKKYDEAIKYYTRLIEEYPNSEYSKATQFNLALSYKALGKLDSAQYAYQRYVETTGSGDSSAQSAQWEIFSIQRDRKDYEGALATLAQIRDGAANPETALEAVYRMGEVHAAMRRPDEAMNAWTQLRGMKPPASPFRLQGLIKLGEAYEKAADYEAAAGIYEDLARNAGKEVAQSAAQRAQALRKMRKPAPATAATRPEPAAPAPEPAEEDMPNAPRSPEAAPQRKGGKPADDAQKTPAKRKLIKLPGLEEDMPALEQIQ